MASQRIDLEQPAHVGPGFSSMSPARRSSSRRCREGPTTQVTEKTAAFQVHSSGYGQVGFVDLLEKALTRDVTRRLRFDVYAADWLHSMDVPGCCCSTNNSDCHQYQRIATLMFTLSHKDLTQHLSHHVSTVFAHRKCSGISRCMANP